MIIGIVQKLYKKVVRFVVITDLHFFFVTYIHISIQIIKIVRVSKNKILIAHYILHFFIDDLSHNKIILMWLYISVHRHHLCMHESHHLICRCIISTKGICIL